MPPMQIFSKTIAGALIAMFLATLGVDFVFHAGILAHYYVHPGPALLPPQQLIRRIPFGYASLLLTMAFELWLMHRAGVRGAKAGAWFGTIFGLLLGAAGAIGLFSLVPLGPDFLAAITVCQILEFAIAGALAGIAIESGRVLRPVIIGSVILIAGVIAGLAMQATGLAPGHGPAM